MFHYEVFIHKKKPEAQSDICAVPYLKFHYINKREVVQRQVLQNLRFFFL